MYLFWESVCLLNCRSVGVGHVFVGPVTRRTWAGKYDIVHTTGTGSEDCPEPKVNGWVAFSFLSIFKLPKSFPIHRVSNHFSLSLSAFAFPKHSHTLRPPISYPLTASEKSFMCVPRLIYLIKSVSPIGFRLSNINAIQSNAPLIRFSLVDMALI